jgi:hypothetical protein
MKLTLSSKHSKEWISKKTKNKKEYLPNQTMECFTFSILKSKQAENVFFLLRF